VSFRRAGARWCTGALKAHGKLDFVYINTDLIFGITHLLGIRFAPRIKDLPDQRLWRLPDSAP
jgi:hypothetical protein